MKKFFTLIILCVVIYGCKPGVPKDIIQPDKMEKVLIDIHIVDGYMSTLNLPNQDTSKKVAAPLYKGVYKKFEIDSASYNKSLNYYYEHPDLMKKMYDSISVKLNILKEQVSKADLESLDQFKGIFDASAQDTSQVDQTLNHSYNYRYLVKQRYGNIGSVVLAIKQNYPNPVPSINTAQPMPVPTEENPTNNPRFKKTLPVQ